MLPLLLVKGALVALATLLGVVLSLAGLVALGAVLVVPLIPLLLLGLIVWALMALFRRPAPVQSV